ncbi:MAG: hypothetical protein JWN38_527 [Candidatus Saccharibacteria bacterium]|nr:hypothetical protein [Candidatus Saccharibacteria bacterium]
MSTDKKYLAGATLWLLSCQYYLVQLIAATAWPVGLSYSWRYNTISDLANTVCGPYGKRVVCSPDHSLMNASFIMLGLTMIGGAVLLHHRYAAGRLALVGFGALVVAGVGTIMVGLFPENTVSGLHVLGAALPFTLGNLGMILINVRAPMLPRWLRAYGLLSGVVGLVALALFTTHVYLWLGIGGMERFVSYPQSIWMTIFGLWALLQRKR